MTDRDYELWAEASITHDQPLAATLPVPSPEPADTDKR